MATKKSAEKSEHPGSASNVPKSRQLIRMLSFRIVPAYYKKIENVADEQGTTVSALIRRYIKEGMVKDLELTGSDTSFRIEMMNVVNNMVNEQNTRNLESLIVNSSILTNWNRYIRNKINASDFQNILNQNGVTDIAGFIKMGNQRNRFLKNDVVRFFSDLGWDEKSIRKLRLKDLEAGYPSSTGGSGASPGIGSGERGVSAEAPPCSGNAVNCSDRK